MAIKLSEIYLTPGRLLVEPIEKSRQDIFEVSESGREISAANVVKVGRLDAEFEGLVPGAAIIYERLNSEALTLQDEEGKDKVYRFVLVRDVAGWVPPVGWVAKPKLPSIKDLIDSRPEYDPIEALRNKGRNTNPTAEQIALLAALKNRETLKDHKYDGMTWVGKLTIPENPTDEQKAAYVRAINFGQLSEGSILTENEFKEKFPSLPPDNIVLSHQPEIKQRIVEILSKYPGSKVDVIESGNDKVIVAVDITGIKGERADNVVGGMGYIGGVDPIDPEKKSQGSFGTDAPDMVLTPDQMDCGYQKINPGIRLDGNLPRKSILEISREMEREAKKTSINNSAKDVFFGYLKSICKAGVIHINDIDAGIMFNCLDPQWKYFAVQDNGNATIFTNEPYNLAYWAPTMGQVFHIVADLEEMKGMQFIADDYSKSLLKRP